MSRRTRGATDLSGVLLVDKPAGMTSHDVVAIIRRITGEGRVGHAGTLDPMATGLLVVLIGSAARLAPYLTAADKRYDARIVFGTRTDTDDADGTIVESLPVPASLSEESVAVQAVSSLVGHAKRVPPAYSAIKQGGVTSYRAARSGEVLELEPRDMTVDEAVLTRIVPGPPVDWDISLLVSKGTYIRSIARDLGEELGTVAHLGGLRRTCSGIARVEDALPLESLASRDEVVAHFTDPIALLGLPSVDVDRSVIMDGRPCAADIVDAREGERVAVVCEGRLGAIYRRSGELLVAEAVLAGGVMGVRR